MKEIFKTLEFIGIEKETLGKYAHPIKIENNKYDWGGGSMPMLLSLKASIKDLKQLYKGLDFDLVKIVHKKLIDINTNNT